MTIDVTSDSKLPDRMGFVVCFAGEESRLPAPLAAMASKAITGTSDEKRTVLLHAGTDEADWLSVVIPGKKGIPGDAEGWLSMTAAAIRKARDVHASAVTAFVPEFGGSPERTVELAVLAARLGLYEFKHHKSKQADAGADIGSVTFCLTAVPSAGVDRIVGRASAVSDAVMLARNLVNEPSSVATPSHLASVARDIAGRETGVTCTVHGPDDMRALGMGALLGIAKGSDEEPRFIELSYRPARAKKTVVIVGKGITFDSGGLSLKPGNSMETMKCDMAGAAAILGVFSVISRIAPKVNVVGLVAATENMPSGHAVKPGDIVTAMNGTTIEILNTDAEGRVVLADALSYASARLKPDEIIDLATLTGACVVALGEEIAGVFSNNDTLAQSLLRHASESGEPLWRMPLADQYRPELKSRTADIKNVSSVRWGGAINGALFLSEFVPDGMPWAHMDIAGPAFAEKDTPLSPYGGTGYGVRTLLGYLSSLS